jgi:transcriptional regulator with XRE-family HTH domain
MSVQVSRDRLDLELSRRGWTAADLALAAQVSPATISGARHGRRVSPRTLRRLASALTDAPTIAGVDLLLGAEAPPSQVGDVGNLAALPNLVPRPAVT